MPGPAFRCSICGIDWPYDVERYKTCPGCEGSTCGMNSADPLEAQEAWSKALHLMFDRYYSDREAASLKAALDTVPIADLLR